MVVSIANMIALSFNNFSIDNIFYLIQLDVELELQSYYRNRGCRSQPPRTISVNFRERLRNLFFVNWI